MASTSIHRHLFTPYPWVQLMRHGSQLPCLLGYLKMTPSPPITPWGHEGTQCGPSCKLAHATHWSAPWREWGTVQTKWRRAKETKKIQVNSKDCIHVLGKASRWRQQTQSYYYIILQLEGLVCSVQITTVSTTRLALHQLVATVDFKD